MYSGFVNKEHPYWNLFREMNDELDYTTIDENLRELVRYLIEETTVIPRYSCEGHLGTEVNPQMYLMVTGGEHELAFMTRVIMEACSILDPDTVSSPFSMEVIPSVINSDDPSYMSFVVRTHYLGTEEEKLELINVLFKSIQRVNNWHKRLDDEITNAI